VPVVRSAMNRPLNGHWVRLLHVPRSSEPFAPLIIEHVPVLGAPARRAGYLSLFSSGAAVRPTLEGSRT
jgi:hypothetical protein